nr:PREDICTED: uncharacterized protein LOC105674836 isoform X1 [Linepithema humile]
MLHACREGDIIANVTFLDRYRYGCLRYRLSITDNDGDIASWNNQKRRSVKWLPNKERHPRLFEKWLQNMNISSNMRISRSTRLCSDHFEENNFYQNNEIIHLRSGSIPTIFNKYKTQCIICKVKKGEVSCSFFKFPIDKPELLKLWLSNIKIENFYPTSTDVICSNHFEKKNSYVMGKEKLGKRKAKQYQLYSQLSLKASTPEMFFSLFYNI